MERLTERGKDGFVLQKPFTHMGEVVVRLAAYEDAEEAGLLVHLPYKVGDTVFIISESCILEIRIFGFVVYYNCMTIMDSKNNEWVVARDRVFLTREEAEAALKGEGKDV